MSVLSISRSPTRRPSTFSALRHRNYRLYWMSQLISLIGGWMQGVSLPWLVLELGGSATQLGIVVALQFAPAALLAPLGGVFADRIDKRRALLVTEALLMSLAALLFALAVTGVAEVWHVMAIALALGLVSAVDMPLRPAFSAELVAKEDLLNSIALNSAAFNFARIVGPALAGVAIVTLGTGVNFGLNAVSYLAALLGLALIRTSRSHEERDGAARPSVLTSLSEGLAFAWRTPLILWPLVLLGGVFLFGMNFQTLLPLFAHDVLGVAGQGYGALYAAMGAGALAAALLLAYLGRSPMLALSLASGAGFVVLEVLLGLSRSPVLAYPLMVGTGFFAMLLINSLNGIVQWYVPDELRGRVMAIWVTVFAGSVPFGGLFAGVVAEHWGSPAGFVLGGLLSGVVLAFVAWQLGRRPGAEPRMAARRLLVALRGNESP